MTQNDTGNTNNTVEFFFDLGSPYSYLASTQLSHFEIKNNVAVIWRPILLGGLFKSVGNQSPFYVEAANKKEYLMGDLQAWASLYDIPFKLPAQFPPNTLIAMRGAIVAGRMGLLKEYTKAMFHAFFVNGDPISTADTVAAIAKTVGMEIEAFSLAVASADVKQALIAATEEAAARGMFGVPTFFYGDQMFFGNDRLSVLEYAVASNAIVVPLSLSRSNQQ